MGDSGGGVGVWVVYGEGGIEVTLHSDYIFVRLS